MIGRAFRPCAARPLQIRACAVRHPYSPWNSSAKITNGDQNSDGIDVADLPACSLLSSSLIVRLLRNEANYMEYDQA